MSSAKPRPARGYATNPRTGNTIIVSDGSVQLRERAKPEGKKSFGPEQFARKRVSEINRLIDVRHPGGIPEHDDDDDGYLFPVAHALHCGRSSDDDFTTRLREWIVGRMQWAADRADQLVDGLKARLHPRAEHMTAAGVAGFLRSTEREKRDLKLSTIGIYGMTAAEYEAWLVDERRRRDRERKSKDRADAGQLPRNEWLAVNSANRKQPWKDQGVGRTAYYERLKIDRTGCSEHDRTGCSTPIVDRLAAEQPVRNVALAPSLDDLVAGTGGGPKPPIRCSPQTPGRLTDAGLCGDQLSFIDQLSDEAGS